MSYVIESVGTTFQARLQKNGWYTGLWRSDSRRVFVTDANGFIQISTERPDDWAVHRTTGMLVGIWGLDDQHVYAWGLRGKTDFILAFDGTSWNEMPAPQGGIVGLHGVSPEALIAVGDGGLIARWDGASWNNEACPSAEPLRAVFLRDDGEAWACGNSGALLRRTDGTWTQVLRHDAPLGGVVHWNGEVWVGAYGALGLSRLAGSTLESIKPNIVGAKLRVSGNSMEFFTTALVGGTEDGAAFKGYGLKGIAELFSNAPAPWD
jgi:hypothetical protein